MAEGLVIDEVEGLTQFDLRLNPHLAERVPIPLPLKPNVASGDDLIGVLWLGPDEWLVVAGPHVEMPEPDLAGVHHSWVDVSANRRVFDLHGPDAREALTQGCSIDLHPAVWKNGMCAQTLYGRAPVILQQRGEVTRVFVRPSFAAYVAERLAASTLG